MKKIEEMTTEELIGKGDYYANNAEHEPVSGLATADAAMASMYYSRALLAGCVTESQACDNYVCSNNNGGKCIGSNEERAKCNKCYVVGCDYKKVAENIRKTLRLGEHNE